MLQTLADLQLLLVRNLFELLYEILFIFLSFEDLSFIDYEFILVGLNEKVA